MKELKAIAFDWGGVIVDDPSKDLQKYCAKYLQCENMDLACEIIWNSMSDFQERKITEWSIWEKVCEEAQGNLKAIPEESLWAKAVRDVLTFKEEILKHIKMLRSLGYKTAFLSNTEPEAAKYFHELHMDKLFDVSILSCEVKLAKPDSKIYNKLCNDLNLHPNEVLLIDDRIENIEGAINFGLNAYLFTNSEDYFKWFKDNS